MTHLVSYTLQESMKYSEVPQICEVNQHLKLNKICIYICFFFVMLSLKLSTVIFPWEELAREKNVFTFATPIPFFVTDTEVSNRKKTNYIDIW